MGETRKHDLRMRSARHNFGAFTLLELVLVLLILAVMAGLVAPSLRGFATGRQTTHTASQLVALARWARSQAIADGTTYRLTLDPAAGTFCVTVQDGAGARPTGTSLGRVFTVPDGVRLECDAPLDQGQQVIRFFANGRTEPATIRLRDASKVVEVSCPSATESYRIAAAKEGA